ncbi:MAG: hypothetical protein LJE62_13555 [Silicimonas sp.]|nr:hypothetical protein [Silicimonas sp.]
MKRQFASTELYALEDNALAIEHAIERVKSRLRDAPQGVAQDVLKRCRPDTHAGLIDWLQSSGAAGKGRLPRAWSPKRNARLWMLYYAADLDCPPDPPRSALP